MNWQESIVGNGVPELANTATQSTERAEEESRRQRAEFAKQLYLYPTSFQSLNMGFTVSIDDYTDDE